MRSRPAHGLQFDFNYVLSKSLDIGSDAERVPQFGGLTAIVNTWAPGQLRGPSDFDANHQINANWVCDLPVGRGQRWKFVLKVPPAGTVIPYPGESGNFRGQGFFGIDMGVNKTFRFTERHSLRFSAYAYNLTNSVRFDPATTFNNALTNTASLGAYSGTLTKPRVMEFALRYQF